MNEKILISSQEMRTIIERLTFQIIEKCQDLENICIVGIRRRGIYIAKQIEEYLRKHNKHNFSTGSIDITLYRDDLTEISNLPEVHSSSLDFDIKGKTLILVDDVLFTGRTIRAAIDAILDYGRPAKIMLAVMVDRGHRELPIQADFVGKHIPTSLSEVVHVKVKEIDNEESVTISKRS